MSWQRSTETKRRLKNLYDKTKYKYARGVWYDEEKDRLIRFQISNKGRASRTAYVKRKCNRAIRRHKMEIGGGKGHYRKMSEYWWDIL